MSNKKWNVPPIGKCFDHLGGKLAPALFNRLLEMNWIKPKEGKKTIFEFTEEGKRKFKEIFDIDPDSINNDK